MMASSNMITRRVALGGALGVSTVAGRRRASAQTVGPIRIGISLSLSGPLEPLGRQELLGAQIAADLINASGGVLGRQLELVVRDDSSNPNNSVQHVNEFSGLNVRMIAGAVSSAMALAVKPILVSTNTLFMTMSASADSITNENRSPNFFRNADSSGMRYFAQGAFVARKYPDTVRWCGLIPDLAVGRAVWDGFVKGLEPLLVAAGKKPIFEDPILFKFGNSDFKNQIASLSLSNADGLFYNALGTDGLTFLSQANATGLLKKFSVSIDAGADVLLGKALGRRIPPGLWTSSQWYHGLYKDVPLNNQLYAEAVKRTGDQTVSGFVYCGDASVRAYAAAVAASRSTEPDAVRSALVEYPFPSAKGLVAFRKEDRQAIADINFLQFGLTAADPGWEVASAFKVAGADAMQPLS